MHIPFKLNTDCKMLQFSLVNKQTTQNQNVLLFTSSPDQGPDSAIL